MIQESIVTRALNYELFIRKQGRAYGGYSFTAGSRRPGSFLDDLASGSKLFESQDQE